MEIFRNLHDAYHAPALNHNLTAVEIRGIYDLLNSVNVRSKGGDNDPLIPVLVKDGIKGLAYGTLRGRKARALGVC